MTEESCDVLIVGGGPTGLVLAGLLADRGVDVVVLERRTRPRLHSRAIGLHPPALAVLSDLGLAEAAVAAGVQVRSGLGCSRGRVLGELSFETAWPERPYVLTLPQRHTERLLIARLAQLSPDALRLGWEVTEVVETGDHVRMSARDTATGTVASWTALLVVGADGPHSLVRSSARIPHTLRELPDRYLMGDFADPTGDPTAVIHLEPDGVVESFPLPGSMRRWVVHTSLVSRAEDPAILAAIIADRTGDAPDPATATMVSAFGVRRRLASRLVSGRTVIVGDAAHEISPIGGQGMTLGWLDARALAPLILESSASGAPPQSVPETRHVEGRLLSAARAAAIQAELNMRLGRPMPESRVRVRDALLRAALSTPARGALARAFTMRRALTGSLG
ncbi:2-polyprenyl-6-methoxyphenol hydroxylase-like FAD-dependent oxidoreductase [Brevibacterium sanguinis]|uniref:2-polyprenyl-6-methoxyphenol hydroxylase-like FAD-dependent oxidoreductase n=2 Tax=Brevibacterium TaxID=1696 RepID=A0A366II14_9MICO|nr:MULTISPECIES: NAD(P)/FAD-dependent oxidoreductase [Brevibacterium]RBP64242.1 2-polyprenyl-6-methoxyphenol hydroxylase-like FAD-dependent oxidoreductase [Brevibacterium sanguinis]RBP71466.1 2-polyprenyl-6-methoxyphenol hydroxylase-like FAD-dependent oxidoreductase [Brevibacterium celere]